MTRDDDEARGEETIESLNARITTLEVKLAYTEYALGQLNDVVTEQADLLARTMGSVETMRKAVLEVREHLGDGGEVQGAMPETDPVPNVG